MGEPRARPGPPQLPCAPRPVPGPAPGTPRPHRGPQEAVPGIAAVWRRAQRCWGCRQSVSWVPASRMWAGDAMGLAHCSHCPAQGGHPARFLNCSQQETFAAECFLPEAARPPAPSVATRCRARPPAWPRGTEQPSTRVCPPALPGGPPPVAHSVPVMDSVPQAPCPSLCLGSALALQPLSARFPWSPGRDAAVSALLPAPPVRLPAAMC